MSYCVRIKSNLGKINSTTISEDLVVRAGPKLLISLFYDQMELLCNRFWDPIEKEKTNVCHDGSMG